MSLFKKSFLSVFALLGSLVLGAAAGIYFYDLSEKQCDKSFRFINAEVVCDRKAIIKKTGYAATQGALETFITKETAAGRASEVAVYFRDLRNGPIFGINETTDFAPASLLKLPTALIYLTQAERNPSILTEQLSVTEPQWSFTEHFLPSEKIDPRELHTTEELLMHMITHSDNDAYGVLQTHLYESGQKNLITETFLELGFIDPNTITDEVLSVRRYASIFRALYNVSYLNADLSEKVLDWLVQSDFAQGIVGGVPEGIAVANKFGERFTEDGMKQLHDCGIIYYPDNPYLLCVMTKGTDFDDLAAIISHISRVVYEEVDSRRIR